jgi:hypothetical protein
MAFLYMGEKHSTQPRTTITPNATDTHTFKEIEQFSKDVCQNLANQYGDQFKQSEVIYGLTAFLSAIHQAMKRKPNAKSVAR